MKAGNWSTFSMTEVLRPADGWKVDHAVMTTYSVELSVVVAALFALSGCDTDQRRTGSRVELVKALDQLGGRFRVLAQAGRVAVPRGAKRLPILKLMDRIVQVVPTNQTEFSWHPKLALVRFCRTDNLQDYLWRFWIGSRNLTQSVFLDTGISFESRQKGGKPIPGIAPLGQDLATRVGFATLDPAKVRRELETITWNCPPGCDPIQVALWGGEQHQRFPNSPLAAEHVYGVSPFLDVKTVWMLSKWGNVATKRTLISATLALEKVSRGHPEIFRGFEQVLAMDDPLEPVTDQPELEGDGEQAAVATAADVEIEPPEELHAKMFLVCEGSKATLWMGSANATERAWSGRNFEAMVELGVGKDTLEVFKDLAGRGKPFVSNSHLQIDDVDDVALDAVRNAISDTWKPEQRATGTDTVIFSVACPALTDPEIRLAVGVFGGGWHDWPQNCTEAVLSGVPFAERSEFIQVRLSLRGKSCSWLQRAPSSPPPDGKRDALVITRQLDHRSFVAWLRSILAEEPVNESGGFWDECPPFGGKQTHRRGDSDYGVMLTVEEILRAYARAPAAFHAASQKVRDYLDGLDNAAQGNGRDEDRKLLQTLRETWKLIALEMK